MTLFYFLQNGRILTYAYTVCAFLAQLLFRESMSRKGYNPDKHDSSYRTLQPIILSRIKLKIMIKQLLHI